MLEGLKESDKIFLELEEKRMKFEEQQKREERQFQMQVLVASAPPCSLPPDPHVEYLPTYHHMLINHSTALGLEKQMTLNI